MTIPEIFAEVWNRTHDLDACNVAVRKALRALMPVRPLIGAGSYEIADRALEMGRLILAVIAQDSGTTVEQLTGKSRSKALVLPRHVGMLFLRNELHVSYPVIGAMTGGRDHSTVMHGCERAETWLASRPATYARLKALVDAALADAGAGVGAGDETTLRAA